jgi:hypothetical protein
MESRALRKFVPTDAKALGMIRAAICGFVFCAILVTDFIDLGRLPVTVMRPTGLMQIFPWRLYDALITPNGMLTFKALLLISLFAATNGFLTSATTKATAVLFLFYQGLLRSFGHFNHDEMPVAYILIVLAFTPCGDAFSLDSLWRRARSRVGDVVYGYPILLMRMLVAWSYFTSAIIKLRVSGLGYVSADNLPTLAIMHSLDNLHDTHFRLAFWLPQFRGASTVVVVTVLLWELAFPLTIFSKTARRIILPLGLVFHLGTLLFMNVFFPYHLAAYLVFVDWPRVFARLNRSRLFRKASSPFRKRDNLAQTAS